MKSKKNGIYSLIGSPTSTWKEKYGYQLSTAFKQCYCVVGRLKTVIK